MSLVEMGAISVLCALMGAMLAGAMLGVVTVNRNARPAMTAAALVAPPPEARVAIDAGPPGPPAEADLEDVGDGVMDDLDDTPVPDAGAPATRPRRLAAAATVPSAAPSNAPSNAPAPRRSGRMVTSDDVPEGAAQGYVDGRPLRIMVTRLDGKPVERRTAAAYTRMRAAAAHDGVQLRIVSGFRTMEHQQALYRAWQRRAGNLAARPGHSNHQSGHALDLNTSSAGVFRWLDRNGRRFGFRRTVPTEAWHWEWW